MAKTVYIMCLLGRPEWRNDEFRQEFFNGFFGEFPGDTKMEFSATYSLSEFLERLDEAARSGKLPNLFLFDGCARIKTGEVRNFGIQALKLASRRRGFACRDMDEYPQNHKSFPYSVFGCRVEALYAKAGAFTR